MEAPSAISKAWGRVEVAGDRNHGLWNGLLTFLGGRYHVTRLPISADLLETGESVKYNQVDSDELTHWAIERFSNQPKDLISTFFSFVQIHWKVCFSKFTSHWQDLSSSRGFSDWIPCRHCFGWLSHEKQTDCSLVGEEGPGGAQI